MIAKDWFYIGWTEKLNTTINVKWYIYLDKQLAFHLVEDGKDLWKNDRVELDQFTSWLKYLIKLGNTVFHPSIDFKKIKD